MIKNFIDVKKQALENSHDGIGEYELFEIWNSKDFKSNIDFIDRVVIPPQSTVGYHKHGNNEEIYIVLEGRGEMTLNGKTVQVKKGDMILNQPWGEHGLVNNSDDVIDLLVVQVSL
ncbi:cupin domain-containing protein [Shewanella sp. KX20019]|uniref:cupin domain-containing protein n=1 Tax=Shewanella sp. KX20019 TaxID=2803864 RepID=UPI0019268EFC|nr:cupin domain-containing protein [Shewanella sp. KX20019]QQX79001.1 cupin domain-containing protein [Shewanella sp. KX20019]